MFKAALACILFLLLGACATHSQLRYEPAQSLVGSWNNAAQFAASPDALKRAPVAGGAYEWLDVQHATFFRVAVPEIAGPNDVAIYLVWRSNSEAGPISRQRLWVFRTQADGSKTMDFYAFKNPEVLSSSVADGPSFTTLSLNDLTAYGSLCALPVLLNANGWSAAIPATCSITARSGRKMVLSAQINVTGNSFTYAERGTLDSGALAFKVPGGPSYQFVREIGVRK
jgi:hypothetical protein